MKPEIKQKWIDALRSGKYQQGTGRLRKNDNFCCLGVLCDLVKDELNIDWEPDIFNEDLGHYMICEGFHYLPKTVVSYCGLEDGLEYLDNNDNEYSLTSLNDTGKTFEYIANVIEERF